MAARCETRARARASRVRCCAPASRSLSSLEPGLHQRVDTGPRRVEVALRDREPALRGVRGRRGPWSATRAALPEGRAGLLEVALGPPDLDPARAAAGRVELSSAIAWGAMALTSDQQGRACGSEA